MGEMWTEPGRTGSIPLRTVYEVGTGVRATWRDWALGAAEWVARVCEGVPVALLAGGPLDAPEAVPAGSMLGEWSLPGSPVHIPRRRHPPAPRMVGRP